MGENVGKKVEEKVGEKIRENMGENVGKSLGEIDKLNLCQILMLPFSLKCSLYGS